MPGYGTPKPAVKTLERRPPGEGTSPAVVLTIVCAGVVLASLDLFIVNVALPQIGRDFHLQGEGSRPSRGS